MDIILYTANAVFPLFVVIGIGYLIKTAGMIDENTAAVVNKVCYKILIPVLLFRTVYRANFATDSVYLVLYILLCYTLVVIPVLCLIVPKMGFSRIQCGAVIQGVFRSNATLIGIPLMTNMYGSENTTPMVLIITLIAPLFSMCATIVLTLFSPSEDGHKIGTKELIVRAFTNPLIVGVSAGLVFNFLKIPLPSIAMKPISDLADIASPLALLILGARFSFESFSSNRNVIAVATVGRLVFVPFIVTSGAVLAGFRGLTLAAIFIASAAPTAITSVAMADAMGSDGRLAGEITISTSLFSCITLFLGLCLLQIVNLV